VTFLFGGQISDGPMELYLIYSAGNFIRCGPDAPYLQIGEHKYGKPILDRAVRYNTDLYEALSKRAFQYTS
jgi:putative proteasome-type protease